MSISKASNLKPSKNTSFLFKSSPGFGKTIAACSAAIFGQVYLAYLDKREPIELLAFYQKFRPDLLENIEYECFGSQNVHEYLNKMIDFAENGCKYAAVITDGCTSLTSAAVNWSLAFRDVSKGGKMDKLNKNAPAMLPDWDEYKVETSLVTQALDITKTLPVMNIWTAHPLPSLQLSGSGTNVTSVTKAQSIVSYGSKVGAMIPGAFNEIYHFGRTGQKRIVYTDLAGDDYARTSLRLPMTLDITDRLFFEVWRDAINVEYNKEVQYEVTKADPMNPYEKDKSVAQNTKWQV